MSLPIRDCDPFELEVHRAITAAARHTLPALPKYVVRAHDARIDELLQAANGESRLITLVGGSSTGKTRACWELIQRLDAKDPGRWKVWHPYDLTHPNAASVIGQIGCNTIVWLNEAQLYLAPSDVRVGERIAAALRTLLRDSCRHPVLILATLWPEYWIALTARPEPGLPDLHAQARELLADTDIDVPSAFYAADLAKLSETNDPRIQEAEQFSRSGRITQYLAGAPELLQRYHKAPPAAKAILDAAIDARRLGHPPPLSRAFFESAVFGYLDDVEWDALNDDWLDVGFDYTARPCKGARGPLTRIRYRTDLTPPPPGAYRLADYLEQVGRSERARRFPPASFWEAVVATVTNPSTLHSMAEAAHQRGRYGRAAALYRKAADGGYTDALLVLSRLHQESGDHDRAAKIYREAADHGHTSALRKLSRLYLEDGYHDRALVVAREAAKHGDTTVLRNLGWLREKAGDTGSATTLYHEAANYGDTIAMKGLAIVREKDGDHDGALLVAREAVSHGATDALRYVAWLRDQAGDYDGARALYREATDHGDMAALRMLTRLHESLGDVERAAACVREAEAYVHTSRQPETDDRQEPLAEMFHTGTAAVVELVRQSEEAGDFDSALAAARDAAAQGFPWALEELASIRMEAGDHDVAAALYREAGEHGSTFALVNLASLSQRVGDHERAAEAAREAADNGDPFPLLDLARVLYQAGNFDGAADLYDEAAEYGYPPALTELARLNEDSGQSDRAVALYQEAANGGDISALKGLAELFERAGNAADADKILRFGLTDEGRPATLIG